MSSEEKTKLILNQVKMITNEIGQLKGSAMKVGQLISTYGEHFLPPEANRILKNLQQKSPPVSWTTIQEQIQNELKELTQELEIDSTPVASASIGQVHKAKDKKTGEIYAMKIQYPGVEAAIETDLKLFRVLLGTLHLLPRGARMDSVFLEARDMFKQEVNYKKELEFTSYYHQLLKDDPRFLVPMPIHRYCTSRIMVSQYIEGSEVDSTEVLSLSQERRNQIGFHYLELYLDELIRHQLVQTDPHFGNYRIQVDPKGQNDRLVLFDFGAMRKVPDAFLKNYLQLIQAGLTHSTPLALEAGQNLKLLEQEDPIALKEKFIQLCFLIMEPFHGEYDWGSSDLPKRVALLGSELALKFKLRSPPKESVFLDRKLGGVFTFLKVLGCRIDARPMLEGYLRQKTSAL